MRACRKTGHDSWLRLPDNAAVIAFEKLAKGAGLELLDVLAPAIRAFLDRRASPVFLPPTMPSSCSSVSRTPIFLAKARISSGVLPSIASFTYSSERSLGSIVHPFHWWLSTRVEHLAGGVRTATPNIKELYHTETALCARRLNEHR